MILEQITDVVMNVGSRHPEDSLPLSLLTTRIAKVIP